MFRYTPDDVLFHIHNIFYQQNAPKYRFQVIRDWDDVLVVHSKP